MNRFRIYLISKRAPQIMSLAALAICIVAWAGIVRDPPGDEGPLAHLYQLLMVGQVPLIAAFLFMAWRQGFRQVLPVVGLQAALWIAAVAALPILGL
jgi:hypothetical protein